MWRVLYKEVGMDCAINCDGSKAERAGSARRDAHGCCCGCELLREKRYLFSLRSSIVYSE